MSSFLANQVLIQFEQPFYFLQIMLIFYHPTEGAEVLLLQQFEPAVVAETTI
jgi:hypothetical protein